MTDVLLWASGLACGLCLVGLISQWLKPRHRTYQIEGHHLALKFLNPFK